MQTSIQAGFAEVDWTPPPGLPVIGQMHERIATHMRDPLYACAAALRLSETTVVLVTVDVCGLANELATAIQAAWAQRTGLAAGTLLIHATHTHVAPSAAGYETWCALSSPLIHNAGNLIVDETLVLLRKVFAEA